VFRPAGGRYTVIVGTETWPILTTGLPPTSRSDGFVVSPSGGRAPLSPGAEPGQSLIGGSAPRQTPAPARANAHQKTAGVTHRNDGAPLPGVDPFWPPRVFGLGVPAGR
jgi:hypothetical protein